MKDPHDTTLIIRLSSVGDVVLSSPLIRALRRSRPGARIDFLVKSSCAELVRSNPHLSGVIEFPAGAGLAALFALRRRIQRERYGLIVDLHDSLRSRLLCAGSPRVVRVRKRKFARFLLVRLKRDLYHRLGGAPPVAERYLETVCGLGVRDDGGGAEVFVPPRDAEEAQALLAREGLQDTRPVIGVCPSARHPTKIWPPERFAAVAAALAHEQGGAVLLFGAAEERELCGDVAREIARRRPQITVVNTCGRMTLMGTAALMDRCALVLCNDSGLMHVAAARKRRVVAVFGPTVRQFGFFPSGTTSAVVEHPSLECRPCTHIGGAACPLGHFRCMREITEERVLEACRALPPEDSPA